MIFTARRGKSCAARCEGSTACNAAIARATPAAARLSRGLAVSTPSPLLGEGWGGRSGGLGGAATHSPTPTPDPSPQGGGEEFAAPVQRKLAPIRATPVLRSSHWCRIITGCPRHLCSPLGEGLQQATTRRLSFGHVS